MSEERRRETHISGDVGKLINIGELHGNVFIINNSAIKKSWEPTPRDSRSSDGLFESEDVTNYINVIIKSNRFGKRIQLRVPQNISVNAFIDTAVATLELPRNRKIKELMISFSFSYSIIYQGKKLPPGSTFSDEGITDGTEVELSIQAIWTDDIEKLEKEESKMNVMYEMTGRMRELQRRRDARSERGIMTGEKIRSWANSFFSYIDELGESTRIQNNAHP